jgi:hypothetical protein
VVPFGADFLLQKVTRRITQAAAIFQFLAHAFPRRNGVLQAVNANGRRSTGQTNAARFFSQHVDLLAGHRRAIRLEQSSILVTYFFSAPTSHFSLHFFTFFKTSVCIHSTPPFGKRERQSQISAKIVHPLRWPG